MWPQAHGEPTRNRSLPRHGDRTLARHALVRTNRPPRVPNERDPAPTRQERVRPLWRLENVRRPSLRSIQNRREQGALRTQLTAMPIILRRRNHDPIACLQKPRNRRVDPIRPETHNPDPASGRISKSKQSIHRCLPKPTAGAVMTYTQFNRTAHNHRYFIDHNSGDKICLCGLVQGVEEKKPSKYHNRTSIYNGISYHSRFEAEQAEQLDWRLKANEIKSWERQVRLDLRVNGKHITDYYIDFIVHHHDQSREFTEVKGMHLSDWKMKWAILEATFDAFKQHPDDRLTLIQQKSYPQKRFGKSQASAILK